MKVSVTIDTKKDYNLDKYDAIVHIRPKDRSKTWYEETVECNLSPSVESRPKGEWEVAEDLPKLDNTFSIRCSKCGQLMLAHYNDDYPNYCCNCGADMRGEE